MAHNIPVDATYPVVATVPADLHRRLLNHQWLVAFVALTVLALGTTLLLLTAGDALSERARQFAAWWWQRPEGLVLGIVALLTTLTVVLGEMGRRDREEKPLYDVR